MEGTYDQSNLGFGCYILVIRVLVLRMVWLLRFGMIPPIKIFPSIEQEPKNWVGLEQKQDCYGDGLVERELLSHLV